MSQKVKFYGYKTCSTCKRAEAFLHQNDIDFQWIDIAANPPSLAKLKVARTATGALKKLFNTSGQRYRELKMSERLKSLTEAEALNALAEDGMLVKRPMVFAKDSALVGFNQVVWQDFFKVSQ